MRVLRAVEKRLQGIAFELTKYLVGAAEYQRSVNPLPEFTFAACAQSDAILLGSMGLPSVRWPNGKEMTSRLICASGWICITLRPYWLYHEGRTPLKNLRAGEIDLVVVRESTERLFSSPPSKSTPADEVADIMRITREGGESICRAALRIAVLPVT